MHTVIAQFSVAEIPEPVPVVVDQVAVKRLIRTRAQPQIPVKVRWWCYWLPEPQGIPLLEVNAARHIDITDDPIVNGLDRPLDVWVGTSLRTTLHHPVIFPTGL